MIQQNQRCPMTVFHSIQLDLVTLRTFVLGDLSNHQAKKESIESVTQNVNNYIK